MAIRNAKDFGKPTAQLDKAIRVANMVGLNIVLQERR